MTPHEFAAARLQQEQRFAEPMRDKNARESLLRDIGVRRAIMAEHDPARHPLDTLELRWCPVCVTQRDGYPEGWRYDRYPCRTVRLLVSSWSFHSDYDESWKP